MRENRSALERFLEKPEHRRIYEQERLLVEATEALAGAMESAGVNRARLAQRIGKSKSFVTQVLTGRHNMTLRTLADLLWALEHRVDIQVVPVPDDSWEIPDFDYGNRWAFQVGRSPLPRKLIRLSPREVSRKSGGAGDDCPMLTSEVAA